MALVNGDGNYLVISNVTKSEVSYMVFKDKEHRDRYKEGNMGNFERYLDWVCTVETDLGGQASPDKTLVDNITTTAYETLKGLEEFAGYQDA